MSGGYGDWEAHLSSAIPNPNGDGTMVYILDTGASFFHGTYSNVTAQDILDRGNFFGSKDTGLVYCKQCKVAAKNETPNLYEYKPVRPLVLLAMDDCRTIRALLLSDVLKTKQLGRAFQCIKDDQIAPLRFSDRNTDRDLVVELCKRVGTDGYASHTMQWHEGGDFHAELYVCTPGASLTLVKQHFCGVCIKRKPPAKRRRL